MAELCSSLLPPRLPSPLPSPFLPPSLPALPSCPPLRCILFSHSGPGLLPPSFLVPTSYVLATSLLALSLLPARCSPQTFLDASFILCLLSPDLPLPVHPLALCPPPRLALHPGMLLLPHLPAPPSDSSLPTPLPSCPCPWLPLPLCLLSSLGSPRRCRDVHHRAPRPPCEWSLPFLGVGGAEMGGMGELMKRVRGGGFASGCGRHHM